MHKLHSRKDQPLVQPLVQHQQISFQDSKLGSDIQHRHMGIHKLQSSKDLPLVQPLDQLLVLVQQKLLQEQ